MRILGANKNDVQEGLLAWIAVLLDRGQMDDLPRSMCG
jgi:hypothetical protein